MQRAGRKEAPTSHTEGLALYLESVGFRANEGGRGPVRTPVKIWGRERQLLNPGRNGCSLKCVVFMLQQERIQSPDSKAFPCRVHSARQQVPSPGECRFLPLDCVCVLGACPVSRQQRLHGHPTLRSLQNMFQNHLPDGQQAGTFPTSSPPLLVEGYPWGH